MPRDATPTLRDRTYGAWLWSAKRAVIAGAAASALHGASWVDPNIPIELIAPSARAQPGLVVRNESIAADEITKVAGIPVTTRVRTAFDLARHLGRDAAVARLDALLRVQVFAMEDVLTLAGRYKGARGVRSLATTLPLVDAGAASPKETWLRLLLMDAGFPRPTTQIRVLDGWRIVGVLDMGWRDYMVAAEYDGDYHRTNRKRYAWDIERQRRIERGGWRTVRVIAEDRPAEIVARLDDTSGSAAIAEIDVSVAPTRTFPRWCRSRWLGCVARRRAAASRTRSDRRHPASIPAGPRESAPPRRPTAVATARRR